MVLRSPRLVVPGDFNIYAEAPQEGAVQEFMTTMDLSQTISGPTHHAGHKLFGFCSDQVHGDLNVGEV